MIRHMNLTPGIRRLFTFALPFLAFALGWWILDYIDLPYMLTNYCLVGNGVLCLFWLTPIWRKSNEIVIALVLFPSFLYLTFISLIIGGVFLMGTFKPVNRLDYEDMEGLFQTELPSSFKIHRIRYMPLPVTDGLNPRYYSMSVNADDFEKLKTHVTLEKIDQSDLSKWLGSWGASGLALHNGKLHWQIIRALEQNQTPTYLPPSYIVHPQGNEDRYPIHLTIDDRSSPTLHLYLDSRSYSY